MTEPFLQKLYFLLLKFFIFLPFLGKTHFCIEMPWSPEQKQVSLFSSVRPKPVSVLVSEPKNFIRKNQNGGFGHNTLLFRRSTSRV